jgi:hypothetical protein
VVESFEVWTAAVDYMFELPDRSPMS